MANDLDFLLKRFKRDPSAYFEEILGVKTLEDYQKNCLEKISTSDRVAIAACHDVGKTYMIARTVHWFLTTHKYSKVITTAPTYNQVKNILWSEIRSAHNQSKFPLGGSINLTEWKIDDGWFALGFTPRNELSGDSGQGTQSSFQGFHAQGGMLIIFDEATGVPHNLWTMAEGLMTSANVKFLCIGNPTSTSSEFYQCFKSREWTKVYLSCFNSPNLIANGIDTLDKLKLEIDKYKSLPDLEAKDYVNNYKVVRPYLLTTKWVVQNSAKWGVDHPLTVSKILGKFPEAGDKALVSLGLVEESQLRVYYPVESDRKIIGVDVARYGPDATLITAMHGKKQLFKKEFYKHGTIEVVGEIINMSREMGGVDIIVVDETGLGGGVVDLLRDEIKKSLPRSCDIRGVQFGSACLDEREKSKYVNIKARMFGLLRDDIKDSEGIVLLNESIYTEELPTILFTYNRKGQMVIESKDEYKKRTGRTSPDASDSLALANYGRYDELNVGTFKKETKSERQETRAPGLKSQRTW